MEAITTMKIIAIKILVLSENLLIGVIAFSVKILNSKKHFRSDYLRF